MNHHLAMHSNPVKGKLLKCFPDSRKCINAGMPKKPKVLTVPAPVVQATPKPPRNANGTFVKGVSGNTKGARRLELIDGMHPNMLVSKYLGPLAMHAIEKVLLHAVTKDPEDINKLDIDVAKFIHDKAFGKAVNKVEMSGPDGEPIRQESVAYKISTLDAKTVEALANAKPVSEDE